MGSPLLPPILIWVAHLADQVKQQIVGSYALEKTNVNYCIIL